LEFSAWFGGGASYYYHLDIIQYQTPPQVQATAARVLLVGVQLERGSFAYPYRK